MVVRATGCMILAYRQVAAAAWGRAAQRGTRANAAQKATARDPLGLFPVHPLHV